MQNIYIYFFKTTSCCIITKQSQGKLLSLSGTLVRSLKQDYNRPLKNEIVLILQLSNETKMSVEKVS